MTEFEAGMVNGIVIGAVVASIAWALLILWLADRRSK